MNKLIKNQKGATALLLTLLILMAMLFIAITASDIIRNGLRMSQAHLQSTKAYYGAESGTERMLWEIRKNGSDPVTDGWIATKCINFDAEVGGDIAIPTTNTCYLDASGNFTHQKLSSNNVIYHTEYNNNGAVPLFIKLKSVGEYEGITRRVVEIGYTD